MDIKEKTLFKNAMEDRVKTILKGIKENYFQLLNSLKFENIDQKKTEKDFRSMEVPEELSEHSIIELIKEADFRLEDEMAIQNQGYIAYMALVNGIKELRNFNSDLHLSLIESMTTNMRNNGTDSCQIIE